MQQKKPSDNAVDEDLAALARTALQHFKEGRLQQARDACQRLLQQQQQHPGAILILGWISHQQREFDMAIKRYQQYLAIKPNDAEAHYTLGLALGELQRTELAIEHFERSIASVANNVAVHRRLGDAYTGLQRLEEAIAPYQTALALEADDVVTIIKLANVFHGVQRYTQSIPLYERALALQPDNAQVHRHLGASLQKFGQTQKAIKCFEQALILRPDYIDARIKLAQVLGELGRAEEALVHLEQLIELKPDDTEAHIILAATLRELGQAEFAIQRLEQLLSTKPDCAALYYHITMLKPKQELIPDLEELLNDPGLPNRDTVYCHFALGNIFQGGESFDCAFKHFRMANARHRETLTYDTRDHTQFVDRASKRLPYSGKLWIVMVLISTIHTNLLICCGIPVVWMVLNGFDF